MLGNCDGATVGEMEGVRLGRVGILLGDGVGVLVVGKLLGARELGVVVLGEEEDGVTVVGEDVGDDVGEKVVGTVGVLEDGLTVVGEVVGEKVVGTVGVLEDGVRVVGDDVGRYVVGVLLLGPEVVGTARQGRARSGSEKRELARRTSGLGSQTTQARGLKSRVAARVRSCQTKAYPYRSASVKWEHLSLFRFFSC